MASHRHKTSPISRCNYFQVVARTNQTQFTFMLLLVRIPLPMFHKHFVTITARPNFRIIMRIDHVTIVTFAILKQFMTQLALQLLHAITVFDVFLEFVSTQIQFTTITARMRLLGDVTFLQRTICRRFNARRITRFLITFSIIGNLSACRTLKLFGRHCAIGCRKHFYYATATNAMYPNTVRTQIRSVQKRKDENK